MKKARKSRIDIFNSLSNSFADGGDMGFQLGNLNPYGGTTGYDASTDPNGYSAQNNMLSNQQNLPGYVNPGGVPAQQGGADSDPMLNKQQGNSFGQNVNNYGAAIGVAGTAIGGLMDANRSENSQKFLGTGPSATQQAVGAAGPWGAAISGISQIGTSAGDAASGKIDEYGRPVHENQFTFGQTISALASPSTGITDTLSNEYNTTGEKVMAILSGGASAGRTRGKAANRQADALEEEARIQAEKDRKSRFDQREQFTAGGGRSAAFRGQTTQFINPTAAGFAYGGLMGEYAESGEISAYDVNTFNNGGSHEASPHGGIPLGTGANGQPNTVEENEVSVKIGSGGKYIFSDRLIYK